MLGRAIIHGGRRMLRTGGQRAAFQFKPAIGERGADPRQQRKYACCGRVHGGQHRRPVPPARGVAVPGGVIGPVCARHRHPQRQPAVGNSGKGATALAFADASPEPFMPVRGQTGLFRVQSP